MTHPITSHEHVKAIELANRLLDEPNCDPDDDLRVLSRQLLRRHEELDTMKRKFGEHPSDGKGLERISKRLKDEALTSNLEGLLPCPFCGTAPNSHSYSIGGKSYAWVECEPCRIRKELHTDGESLRLQIFAMDAVTRWWNRRPVSADPPAPETTDRSFKTFQCVGAESYVDGTMQLRLRVPGDFPIEVPANYEIRRAPEPSAEETNTDPLDKLCSCGKRMGEHPNTPPWWPCMTYTNEAPAHPPILPKRFNSVSQPEKASEHEWVTITVQCVHCGAFASSPESCDHTVGCPVVNGKGDFNG